MMTEMLCTIFKAIFFPDRTATKNPAVDMVRTARLKAMIEGISGPTSHMSPIKKGIRLGTAPMVKNRPVVLMCQKTDLS